MNHSETGPGATEGTWPSHDGEEPVVSHVVDADGIPLSARVSRAARPRAVVLALHGGGTTSTYFDCPGRPPLSLLRTGAALGFTVIALDRPGYGASAGHAEKVTEPAHRVDLAYTAVDRLLGSGHRGAGVFLLAHSAGSELAVRMAADERGRDLLGLEIAGTGRQHHPRTAEVLESGETDAPRPVRDRNGLRDLLWGPSHLYPPDVFGGTAISGPTPAYESEAQHWTREFPELAARVRIPVRFSLGDQESVWRSGPAALADIASLFTASPRVLVNEQPDSGHNLSLGNSALAYHLSVLSFAEACGVSRTARPDHGRTG
ncbi:alpha/beta hydrolase [Streptomyces sp. NPDC058001]|uniref:alpha/beta hydrolase n=1 Tax=Streptomyces sp. NPDC058001 TaxID=3346300 RepID=UPI0036E3E32B